MMNKKDDFEWTERNQLRAMLLEDTDSPHEAELLLETVERVKQWRAPQADPNATALLVKSLMPELPQPSTLKPHRVGQLIRDWWPLLLIRAQLRVVRREIWAASALVMALGTLVTLAGNASNGLTPIEIFAPLVAAVGVAFLL